MQRNMLAIKTPSPDPQPARHHRIGRTASAPMPIRWRLHGHRRNCSKQPRASTCNLPRKPVSQKCPRPLQLLLTTALTARLRNGMIFLQRRLNHDACRSPPGHRWLRIMHQCTHTPPKSNEARGHRWIQAVVLERQGTCLEVRNNGRSHRYQLAFGRLRCEDLVQITPLVPVLKEAP